MRSIVLGTGRLGFALRLALLLLFPLVAGCSPKTGKVSGTVLFNGKPLPGGRVTFRPADPKRNSVSVERDEQGHYEAELPTGEVQVCVDNRELEPTPAAQSGDFPLAIPAEAREKLKGVRKPDKAPVGSSDNAPEKLPGKYVPIPEKYYTVEESGLKFTVQGGDQKQDIELKK